MNSIKEECNIRGITRLCHFTQSRNMAHIFDEPYGIYATRTLKKYDMPHNPTDTSRFDGCEDLVCCSIEYPNTYYFHNVRSRDPLFKDWVVLYIDPKYIWHPQTRFCSCNAARECGSHIKNGLEGFQSLFEKTSPGISFTRKTSHLLAAPTDIQAEVLVVDPIPLESITGIVVQSDEQAQRELLRLRLQGLSFDRPIYVVPDFFERTTLSPRIQGGIRIIETLFSNGGCHGR